MRAFLKNYRQSPRKVRLVTNLIKGKSVVIAERELTFLPKRAAEPLSKLLASAISNALINTSIQKENLIVKDFTVNKGTVLKRMMPRARGSGARINKRSSHVLIVLEEMPGTAKAEKEVKKVEKKPKVIKKLTKLKANEAKS